MKKILDFLKQKTAALPSPGQWSNFFRVLNKKEKNLFLACAFCFAFSFIFLIGWFRFHHTEKIPTGGGIFSEGVIGQPRFINPVLANNDIDRDLIELVFSGLMKYDTEGRIVLDLAKNYEIKENGILYEVTLREDVFWHDGEALTADDVLFTIRVIQDPDYHSPEITNWVGIEVEKISNTKISFRLKNAYYPFLERLTLKILPRHIFKDISPENFSLTVYNLQPIGSGPFAFRKINQQKDGRVEAIGLTRYEKYFAAKPYLKEFVFYFFDSEEELIRAGQKRQIQGLVLTDIKQLASLEAQGFKALKTLLPRYFAVFFNPEKNKQIADEKIRQALILAIDKAELLRAVTENRGEITSSPILPEIYDFQPALRTLGFDPELARKLFAEAGFEIEGEKIVKKENEIDFNFKSKLQLQNMGQEVEALQTCLARWPEIYPEGKITGYFGENTKQAVIRFQEAHAEEILKPQGLTRGTGVVSGATQDKLNEICRELPQTGVALKFSLHTADQPLLQEIANELKTQWEAIGLEIEIKTMDFGDLNREIIKPREYEMLLFGQSLNLIPDPFPFWHSSRTKDSGLNLAAYQNKKADEYLKEARQATNRQAMQENLEAFQEIILEDNPALFLFTPDFEYLVSNQLKGLDLKMIADPSKRFIDVQSWHFNTKRVWR